MQQTINCPNCGSSNVPGQKFCGVCGTKLTAGCPSCGIEIDPGARFCGNCGAQITGGMQQPGWGQQPGGMQQPGWGQQPGGIQQPGTWGAPPQRRPTSSSGTYLIILLVVLLLGLGGFGYWAFYGSPPWGTSTTPSSLKITSGPFVNATTDNATGELSTEITWGTNELAIGQIEYGEDTNYGSKSSWESNYTKSHSISLPNLNPATSYHYRIISKDNDANEVTSNDKTFTTPQ